MCLIRKSLKDKERKKNPGYSWIEVSKKVHLFRAGDVSAPQFEAIHESLEMLYSLMAREGYVPDPPEVSQNLEEEEEKRRLVWSQREASDSVWTVEHRTRDSTASDEEPSCLW